MRVAILQHVPFEGIGRIAQWLDLRSAQVRVHYLHAGCPLPELDAFELLIVMGGPMSVHDEAVVPWLAGEKALIRAALVAESACWASAWAPSCWPKPSARKSARAGRDRLVAHGETRPRRALAAGPHAAAAPHGHALARRDLRPAGRLHPALRFGGLRQPGLRLEGARHRPAMPPGKHARKHPRTARSLPRRPGPQRLGGSAAAIRDGFPTAAPWRRRCSACSTTSPGRTPC